MIHNIHDDKAVCRIHKIHDDKAVCRIHKIHDDKAVCVGFTTYMMIRLCV